MTDELIKQNAAEVANPTLQSIDPEKFAIAVFEKFNTDAEIEIAALDHLEKYDITTKEGLEVATKKRAIFREFRIKGENDRKAYKAPLLETGKLIDAAYVDFKTKVEPYESRFDAEIKAEEKRKEDIKAEAMRVKAERESVIESRIAKLRDAPLKAIGMTATECQSIVDSLKTATIDKELYDERDVEAELLRDAAIPQIEQLIAGKVAQETLAANQKLEDEKNKQLEDEKRRVELIELEILKIKNVLMTAMDCESSRDIEKLINDVSKLDIDADKYQEFTENAEAVKAETLKTLNRQFEMRKSIEDAEAKAEAEKLAKEIEAKPTEAPTQQDKLPEELKQPFKEIFTEAKPTTRPTAQEIVMAVAVEWKVNSDVALQWLRDTDFSELKIAA